MCRVVFFVCTALLNMRLAAQPAEPRVIEGRLTDAATGEPVAYASVGIAGETAGTSSNAEGYFTLRIPSSVGSNYSLRITCVGYESEVITNPATPLHVAMRQSRTILKDVVVFGKDLKPENIVRRAFRYIPRNYYTKPFIYQSFYRHYCKDDTVYGRLIEAAVDIYKRKGYKVIQPFPGWKDEVRVNQLRKSYDYTRQQFAHVPIALYGVMSKDIAGYQVRSRADWSVFLRPDHISRLKKNINNASFSLEGMTMHEGEEVYIINYKILPPRDSLTFSLASLLYGEEQGTLYIHAQNYGILKAEYHADAKFTQMYGLAVYKKVHNKYFLQHLLEEGKNFNPRDSFTHVHHLELITTDIQTENIQPFKGREPSREKLLQLRYDSVFWTNYNILKATPLEEKIVADLEKQMKLTNQFVEANEAERQRFMSGEEDEERFNQFLKSMRGQRPVYIDFWASWCGPCLKEMPHSMRLVEKYRDKIAFVFLSIDYDPEAWKNAIRKFNLDHPPFTQHFRIGPDSDAAKLLDVNSIPRYVLVNKEGNFVQLKAARPSDTNIFEEIERLLAQEN
ncbi:MAG: thioredoxin-like domain-containing protein [Cyclobacteriaceae bacterium]